MSDLADLDRAFAHVRAHRWREAATVVLDIWSEYRDPALLAVLDALDDRAELPPVRADRGRMDDREWSAAVGSTDPLEVGRALAAPDHPNHEVMGRRVVRVAALRPDPRAERWKAQRLGTWADTNRPSTGHPQVAPLLEALRRPPGDPSRLLEAIYAICLSG